MNSAQRMPVLFIGHGNPMNATPFVVEWRETAVTIPRSKAILCISAHWETDGTKVTDDPVAIFADQVLLESISMQSVKIG
jgi:4,5-DOPA dioxygenase extradiol